MKCFCEAEISASARFCPHCGTQLAQDLAQSATATIPLPLTKDPPTNGYKKRGRIILTEATTLKEADWIPPLPPKYMATLQQGVAAEMVMWEMFKRIIELRNLLEETVTSWPSHQGNSQINRVSDFLRSHCASCGDSITQVINGNTPICGNCQNI